jgi:aspartyl-tRNA(Asn)/glutamyl-tRNA(Gln) amidotransferase subunit B
MEIVTEPVIRSSEEAHAFLSQLRRLVRWIGVSDANMEEGSLRCDANVSLRPSGESKLGTRVELKNLNSFRHVARAIDHEVIRQGRILEGGGAVERTGETRPMRSKEESHDYRYFPDPDLPLLVISEERIERLRAALPELPEARGRRFVSELGMSEEEAGTLTASRELADYFDELVRHHPKEPRRAANWVRSELLGAVNARGGTLASFPVRPERLAGLLHLVEDGTLSGKLAKRVFSEMIDSGDEAAAVVERLGLVQIADPDALRPIVERVIEEDPDSAAQFAAGKEKAIGRLVGQVMRATRGKASPAEVNRLLRERLLGS